MPKENEPAGHPAASARHARRRARSMADARAEHLDQAHAYWQRACYAVRDLVHPGHPLNPEGAFAGLDDELGQWLNTQCVNYRGLAEEQRRQLAAIGLTDEAAATARPNPATRKPSLETGLHYARSHVALHGNLDVAPSARHQGFPLGAWLARQRHQAALHAAKFGQRRRAAARRLPRERVKGGVDGGGDVFGEGLSVGGPAFLLRTGLGQDQAGGGGRVVVPVVDVECSPGRTRARRLVRVNRPRPRRMGAIVGGCLSRGPHIRFRRVVRAVPRGG
ncbi:helicase associated domain-containing protein [Embleya sp. NPDC059237]|uniref:helicase associated domain-containing protein n=1 Tax=Embleya sp. NPDC059237 TaxID=3346784 RepID=UPI0036C5EDBF